MVKGDSEDSSQSEHGNWNVASDYAKLKIMKHLYDADKYEVIALFGHYDLLDELMITVDVDLLKIHGLRRLVNTLLMLINNSIFAVKDKKSEKGKKKTDREILNHYKAELKKIKKIISKNPSPIFSYKVNQIKNTKVLKIDIEKYQRVLDFVIEIKAKINEPLNRYDLIFAHKEDFDSETAKKLIKDGLIERG